MAKIELKDIENIETKSVVKNLNWFYHGFSFENFAEIMEKGVLAKKYLDFPVKSFGLNGKHYISIAKDTNKPGNALNSYKRTGPLVILDDIEAIKCKNKKLYGYFKNTFFPFRYTEWNDEYQVYSKILPEKFVGLECMVYDWARENNLFLLKRFYYMLEKMIYLDISLPIYDYSREENNKVHELDKEAFLEIGKSLINKKIYK